MEISQPCLNYKLSRKLATFVIHELNILRGPTKSVAMGRSDDKADVVMAEL